MTRRGPPKPAPTAVGLAALEERPMTPEQVADLVERVKIASRSARFRSIKGARHKGLWMSPRRVAAHYARFTGESFLRAARAVTSISGRGMSASGVQGAYRKIYGKRGDHDHE